MNLLRDATLDLRVMDMTGKVVFTRTAYNDEGLNKLTVPTSALPTGVYVMSVIAEDQVVTKRFVVQR